MENNNSTRTRAKTKRKRGGQPGNRNACTHGFYSGHLDPTEINMFWELTRRHRIAPEIAVILAKLPGLLQSANNRRALYDASAILARCYSAKYRLGKKTTRELMRLIFDILSSCDPGATLESILAVLQNESGAL